MVRILSDSVSRFVNPSSPRDSIEIHTHVILAPQGMAPAEAVAALGLEPGDDWTFHKDLPSEGADALIVAVRTVAG